MEQDSTPEVPQTPIADSQGRTGLRVSTAEGSEEFINQTYSIAFDPNTGRPAEGWSIEEVENAPKETVSHIFYRAWPSRNREILYIERCVVNSDSYTLSDDNFISYTFGTTQDAMYVSGAWHGVRAFD